MKLFGKKKEEDGCCCCGAAPQAESAPKTAAEKTEGARVKVLGSGCAKCNQLEASVKEARQSAWIQRSTM
jgi:hypothetical protein